jgi:hypothetical protein
MAIATELSEEAENLIPALEALSVKDRAKLACRLLASLDNPGGHAAEVQADCFVEVQSEQTK